MKAAFQGVHGAYSELASKKMFGETCQTIPYEKFEDVFSAVEKGKVERGIVPIENSLAGSIHQNYDLLLSSNVHIVGEVRLKVEHVLMCHPSTSLKNITQVRSHPQALAQCSDFFATEKKISPVIFFDTAGAAESLIHDPSKNIGAIASAYAAELYQLKVLRTQLQNQSNNFTRFLALEKGGNAKPSTAKVSKTSIVFKPKKNSTGILFNILGVFALRNIDLLKIESRPNPLSPFEYWFYIDFAGSIHSPQVDMALSQLKEMTAALKILGSYAAANNNSRK